MKINKRKDQLIYGMVLWLVFVVPFGFPKIDQTKPKPTDRQQCDKVYEEGTCRLGRRKKNRSDIGVPYESCYGILTVDLKKVPYGRLSSLPFGFQKIERPNS